MKACVIQPAYSVDYAQSDAYFGAQMALLEQCDDSLDLIVLPELADVPCLAKTMEQIEESYRRYHDILLQKAAETARRCGATLFVNAKYRNEDGSLRNTTFAFDRTGASAGHYFKQHLTPGEMKNLDRDYSLEFNPPTILEIDGVRYGFLVCYDSYFYEAFANIARYDPEVIIVCSHQRSDSHRALELMTCFCGYNCNAYMVRASVSMGADSPVGGCSMITAPDGTVLANLKNEVGLAYAEFDPHQRYLKPAGFGNPDATHHSYIETGRRPWKYRIGGSAIVRHDAVMPFPRLCAHRGFNSISPENSMPAFGAAVALGAQEIEFDLWPTKDGEVVSTHDSKLDRVSNGTGRVWEHTYAELAALDFQGEFGPAFAGLQIPRFSDILKKFAGHTMMNIHIKSFGADKGPMPEDYLRKITALIKEYDCEKYCYFTTGNLDMMEQLRRIAPQIGRCVGAGGEPQRDLVAEALRFDAQRIQLFKPHFVQREPDYLEKTIAEAHAKGIICNIFWSDDPEETKRYLEMGIDTVLTNDYLQNARVLKTYLERNR